MRASEIYRQYSQAPGNSGRNPSSDSKTENILESHVMRWTGRDVFFNLAEFRIWCQEVWLLIFFLSITFKPLHWSSKLSYRRGAPVWAKFCLIWYSLSKPEIFLSLALLVVRYFTITICCRYLRFRDFLREQLRWERTPFDFLPPHLTPTFRPNFCFPKSQNWIFFFFE